MPLTEIRALLARQEPRPPGFALPIFKKTIEQGETGYKTRLAERVGDLEILKAERSKFLSIGGRPDSFMAIANIVCNIVIDINTEGKKNDQSHDKTR